MRKYKIFIGTWTSLLFAISIIFLVNSCRHESISMENIPNPTIYFTTDVLPIFQTNCAVTGCHDGGSNSRKLVLNNYNEIIKDVQKGNPQESKIYTVLNSTYGGGMPPNKPLTESQRSIIRLWIQEGALNNSKPDSAVNDSTIKTKALSDSYNNRVKRYVKMVTQ
jgi:hypothetical protein